MYVSADGDDSRCRRNDPSRPCTSFDRAYRLARCGETVLVTPGEHSAQKLGAHEAKNDCVSPVFFDAAGAFTDDLVLDGAMHVTVRRLTSRRGVSIQGGARDVTIANLNGGKLYVGPSRRVKILGGDFGPCPSTPTTCGSQSFVDHGEDVLIDGATFHDFALTSDGDHWECLFVSSARGLTIRNSRFFNCETYGIFLNPWHSSQAVEGVKIVDNWFGRTCCFGSRDRNSAINVSSAVRNVLIRDNSFVLGQTVVQEGGPPVRGVRIVGNVLGDGFCLPGASYEGNLAVRGTCGSSDRRLPYGYELADGKLRPARRQGRAVVELFERVAAGASLRKAAVQLRAAGHPSPRGGWTVTAVRSMLTDPVYRGNVFGAAGYHPPLVGKRLWRAVRAVVPARQEGGGAR